MKDYGVVPLLPASVEVAVKRLIKSITILSLVVHLIHMDKAIVSN